MGVNVICVDGPYEGREFAAAEPDSAGMFLFQGSKFGKPRAVYLIDYDAEPVPTEDGPAQPAKYFGTKFPIDAQDV